MSQSTHKIAITGADKTGSAFESIQARAIAAGRKISSAVGGAIAAAGAYLSFRSVKGAIDELGGLSDMAMKAETSVEALTKTSLALQVAGLNLPVEALTRSFQYLAKTSGDGSMANFYKVLDSIARIEDPAKRGAELMRNFGRSSLELLPLIEGGEEAVQKMRTLAEVMPGVSDAAAAAGDSAADSLKIMGTGAHNLFLKVVGNIVEMWSKDFPGGIRAGALAAMNWLETFAHKAKAAIAMSMSKVMAYGAWVFDAATVGVDTANKVLQGTLDAADEDFQKRMEKADEQRSEYIMKLKTLNVDDLAGALGGRQIAAAIARSGGATATDFGGASTRLNNALMMANSNEALKLTMLGPQVNEAKKQTKLLEDIAKNTEKTADGVESSEYTETDLGA